MKAFLATLALVATGCTLDPYLTCGSDCAGHGETPFHDDGGVEASQAANMCLPSDAPCTFDSECCNSQCWTHGDSGMKACN